MRRPAYERITSSAAACACVLVFAACSPPGQEAPDPSIETAVTFEAVYSQGGEVLTSDLAWDIFTADKNAEGKRTKVTTEYQARPTVMLPGGDYYVVARSGEVKQPSTVRVAQETPFTHTVNLNAGYARLHSVLTEGAEPLTSDVAWDIFEAETNMKGDRTKVTTAYTAQPLVLLPAGQYLVRPRTGKARAEAAITVNAGERTESTVDLNAGYARFQAIPEPGGEPITDGLTWDIHEAEANLKGEHRKITTEYKAQPLITLPAGAYRATVRGDAGTVTTEFTVTAGQRYDGEVVYPGEQ